MQAKALAPSLLVTLSLMILAVALDMDRMPLFQGGLIGLSLVTNFAAVILIVVGLKER